MSKGKDVTVTFKVDENLMEAIKEIPNRSEFIRAAVLSALDNTCPLCSGTGTLTPGQKQHWETFSADHKMGKCGACNEQFVICNNKKDSKKCVSTRRKNTGKSRRKEAAK